MTIYGWDASHYDGTLTRAILARAKAEGIDYFMHKIGEGLGGEDATQGTALAAARDAGIQVIGGYWFGHGGDDPVASADACVALADRDEPWWRDFGGWLWECDAETSPSGKPSRAWVQKFCDRLAATTGRYTVVYASHGEYGDTLTGLTYDLWNANYPSREQLPFKQLYPGDSYAGWNAYSGKTPVLCQYASSATIAGRTTCDANAFRGTLDDLLTLVTGNGTGDLPVATPVDLTPAAITAIGAADDVKNWRGDAATNPTMQRKSALYYGPVDVLAAVAALSAKVDALAEQLLGKPPTTVAGDFDVTGTLHLSTPPA